MRPSDYGHYPGVHDLFSDPHLNPRLGRFVCALAAQGQFAVELADPPFYFLRKALGAILPSPPAP